MISRAIFNQTPLPPNRLSELPLGAIKPEGWLREQLLLQAAAMKAVPENPDSAWLGGGASDALTAPGRVMNLLLTGYALGDDELRDRALSYIEWTIASQKADGFFGPEGSDLGYARVQMLRAMRLTFTATGDKRTLMLMDKYFKYMDALLKEKSLEEKEAARAGDIMREALWLYNLTNQKYLLALCKKLKAQSLDWTNQLTVFPAIRPTARMLPWEALVKSRDDAAREPVGMSRARAWRDDHLTNAADVAAGLKEPGVTNLFKSGYKEVNAFRVGWQKLTRHHGVACGMFTGDDHLAGGNPTQGVSPAAVVEAIVSLKTLMGTGDEFGVELADILEKMAFNALPASYSADMTRRQAAQQTNQVRVSREKRPWYNLEDDANMFLPTQPDAGFPEFVSALWYATNDGGLAAVSYAPCSVNFTAGGTRVRLTVSTAYPFGGEVSVRVEVKSPAEFPLYFRVPGWTAQSMITLPDGEIMQMRGGENACVRRVWTGDDTVTLDLPMEPRVTRWYHRSGAVELGALVMCLNPGVTRDIIEGDEALCARDAWNWALVDGQSMKAVFDVENVSAFKHGKSAARVLVKAAKIDWGMEGASGQQPPIDPETDPQAEEIIELTPYGDSVLRVAQFPIAGRASAREADLSNE